MPEMIRTARANGIPDNSSTYAVLSSIFGSMYNLGGTIGPFISGICDEHFGFQWAMSVAGFICLSHAVLLVLFTLYEYMVTSREHVNNRLLDEEGKLLSTNWNLVESAKQFAWSHREPCKPEKCKSIAGLKGYWPQLALTLKKLKSWLGEQSKSCPKGEWKSMPLKEFKLTWPYHRCKEQPGKGKLARTLWDVPRALSLSFSLRNNVTVSTYL